MIHACVAMKNVTYQPWQLDALKFITRDDVRTATTSDETMLMFLTLIEDSLHPDGLPGSRHEMPPEVPN